MCKVDNWVSAKMESERLHEEIINISFEEMEFQRDTERDPMKYYRCIYSFAIAK